MANGSAGQCRAGQCSAGQCRAGGRAGGRAGHMYVHMSCASEVCLTDLAWDYPGV